LLEDVYGYKNVKIVKDMPVPHRCIKKCESYFCIIRTLTANSAAEEIEIENMYTIIFKA